MTAASTQQVISDSSVEPASRYSVALFFSNNYAIWTSKLLARNQIECKVIPVPRHLSSDCGYCVRLATDQLKLAIKLLDKQQIEYDRFEAL
ncbi:DUF3343 domain-containing protein [Shewanella maritima]|uniref:DUF3343 domain-containing protein n=1 Tax=Shewanella maritima TaxID=2520507 RepID=A0A411PGH3_9GAMM|nr:DUF3343 domain-containing protein [Shewanella maritima]QBF82645.1 DUF3343 domain-containing protein [Shewanella maritima]